MYIKMKNAYISSNSQTKERKIYINKFVDKLKWKGENETYKLITY